MRRPKTAPDSCRKPQGLDKRRVYYDHEPGYRRLLAEGKDGWESQTGGPSWLKRYWDLFNATGFLPPRGSRALDFGCGGGQLSILLGHHGYEVTGIDFSETAIQMASRNVAESGLRAVTVLRQDALCPDLPAASFDVILSINMLHCFIGPDRATYLGNIAALLKPGGVAALACMVGLPHGRELRRKLGVSARCRTDTQRTRYFATQRGILAEVAASGMKNVFIALRRCVEDPHGNDALLLVAELSPPGRPVRKADQSKGCCCPREAK